MHPAARARFLGGAPQDFAYCAGRLPRGAGHALPGSSRQWSFSSQSYCRGSRRDGPGQTRYPRYCRDPNMTNSLEIGSRLCDGCVTGGGGQSRCLRLPRWYWVAVRLTPQPDGDPDDPRSPLYDALGWVPVVSSFSRSIDTAGTTANSPITAASGTLTDEVHGATSERRECPANGGPVVGPFPGKLSAEPDVVPTGP